MRPWRNLGLVVDTIYEEACDDDRSSSSSSFILSPSVSSPNNTPLHSRVEAWSEVTGHETDVLIHVQGTVFYLHKAPLSSRSTYLRQQLTEHLELTLSPPLKITPETFTLVADFCYGTHVAVTPFNVAALRLAADLLQMKETDCDGDQNLWQLTESYFRLVIAVNGEYASVVFKSCLLLLPEVETTAFLVGRCLEALNSAEDGDGVESCLDEIIALRAEDFKIVADSMHRRFSRHDAIYKVVDFYFEEQSAKLTEEQKIQICNYIDCNKLSPGLLLHAVQNPKMPLRFIVRAMLVEQLNTRRSIVSSTGFHHPRNRQNRGGSTKPTTLGHLLQRDAAVRETTQLRVAMEVTSSRIETLEREISGMKKILENSEVKRIVAGERSLLVSGRSKSFHYGSREKNEMKRSKREKMASASSRFARAGEGEISWWPASSPENWVVQTPRLNRNIGSRLIKGIRNVFWVPNSGSETKRGIDNCKKWSEVEGGKAREKGNGIAPPKERFCA